jgi:hypothetical protein
MCAANVEEEIVKLGSEVSGIYFQAKETLTQLQDSRSERFSAAARIVRGFLEKSCIDSSGLWNRNDTSKEFGRGDT